VTSGEFGSGLRIQSERQPFTGPAARTVGFRSVNWASVGFQPVAKNHLNFLLVTKAVVGTVESWYKRVPAPDIIPNVWYREFSRLATPRHRLLPNPLHARLNGTVGETRPA